MRKLSPLLLLLVSACMVGPDYDRFHFDLPADWTQDSAADTKHAALQEEWWNQFEDPTLTALEKEALAANSDLAVAAARVAQARASLRLSDADLYPDLSAEAGASRIGNSKETKTTGTYNQFSVAAVLDYEIDLWGKLRRASEYAQAQLLAGQANRDAVRLAVESDVATGYFNLLALQAEEQVTQATVKSRQASFDYQAKQYKAGFIDALTYRNAEASLASAQAALPAITQARVEQQQAMAILLGRTPEAMVKTPLVADSKLDALPVPPTLPADAPSTLLERRPDVAAAEQQLIASNAAIGVAKADYYPTLSLSALLGLASSDLDRLLRGSAKEWQLGASGAMPILDFGRTGANVDAAKAVQQEALATYQQTVRQAFADTLNALSGIDTAEARAKADARQVKANQEALRVANLRYKAGYSNQLDQLDAERQLYQSQLDDITAKRDRLSATVTLYKALGGGWQAPKAD